LDEVLNEKNYDLLTNKNLLTRISSALKYSLIEVPNDLVKVLFTGFFLGGILSAILPSDLSSIYGKSLFKELIIFSLLSIPLYICATSSVPLAQVLIEKGVSSGAIIVLLMAGPASNTTTILCTKKEFGTKGMLAYLFSVSLVSVLGAIIWNKYLDKAFLVSTQITHIHSSDSFSTNNLVSTISGIVLLLILLRAILLRNFLLRKLAA